VRHFKLITSVLVAAVFSSLPAPASAQSKEEIVTASLPKQVGDFRLQGAPKSSPPSAVAVGPGAPADYLITGAQGAAYVSAGGAALSVTLIHTRAAGAAHSLLLHEGESNSRPYTFRHEGGLGIVGDSGAGSVKFVAGKSLVDVAGGGGRGELMSFAKLFSEQLGGGETPPLLLHLPEWDKRLDRESGYAVTLPALQQAAGDRPALDAISFEGGAEAATARYGDARLVIVEFSTPQHSVDNDARVNERIGQLRAAGQPVPSFYGRVGNYSVFVFDAPDEAAARELASGVRYEKDVRWLGRNPREAELVQRYYTQTMGGVFVTTLITTGAAILFCLGVGGLIGGAVFMYRRTRPGASEAYSDAGGMMRLKLEDLDVAGGAPKLLGPKNE
jgi:hypothetical protein